MSNEDVQQLIELDNQWYDACIARALAADTKKYVPLVSRLAFLPWPFLHTTTVYLLSRS